MKVFLVDDNPVGLKLMAQALHKAGYEIAVARNGIEAVARVAGEQPDIIVMDVMMPKMDGFEATRQIRANPDVAHVPIILLTARDQIEDKLTGFGSGADDYVIKPVLPAELVARINALVRRSQIYAEASLTRGQVLGFLGVKGGVGTTTLAVNVAISLAKEGKNVILVDAHPWAGAVALHMGLSPRLDRALRPTNGQLQISRRLLESSFERHQSGVQVLAIPRREAAPGAEMTPEQVSTLIDMLETMGDIIVLDMGNGISPETTEMMKVCHRTILVLEGDTVAINMAVDTLRRLSELGIAGSRLQLVMVNRSRSASTYTRAEVEEQLGKELLALVTPAPEISFHATKSSMPIVLSQANTVTATQLRELGKKVV
jgi:CheY-like chemotaxis protein/MinD-like ATPase involved in chromosome partitioning or flagellar assembly